MTESLASLLQKIADHALGAIVGFVVLLGIGVLIGNPGEIVRDSSPAESPATGSSPTDSWPDGESAWTVILASESTRGKAEAAIDRARRVPDRGLSLGVLNSDDYSSLRNGYWVAFAGQFASVEEAQDAASRYRPEFPTAYQRFIEEE